MNFSICLKSFFVINLLWVSASYSMYLVRKGMTPEQAAKKCISDCNHRGLKELFDKPFLIDCKKGRYESHAFKVIEDQDEKYLNYQHHL